MSSHPAGQENPLSQRTREPIDVALVTSNGCHFCDDAAELLLELSNQFPLRIRTVDLASDEGAAIARRYRVPFPPVVLIDGAYFGYGRISRRKLAMRLTQTKEPEET